MVGQKREWRSSAKGFSQHQLQQRRNSDPSKTQILAQKEYTETAIQEGEGTASTIHLTKAACYGYKEKRRNQ